MARTGSKIIIFCMLIISGLGSCTSKDAPATDAQSKELFLTPGGLYTKEDILANGSMTPAQKYPEAAPAKTAAKNGEPTCPVSQAKAHVKYTWVVGGKTYQFCNPSCIASFVKMAKEEPEKILGPDEYVK